MPTRAAPPASTIRAAPPRARRRARPAALGLAAAAAALASCTAPDEDDDKSRPPVLTVETGEGEGEPGGEGEGEGDSADGGAQQTASGLRSGCDTDDDPLTRSGWAGFCQDRLDDNCAVDVPDETCPASSYGTHTLCNTADEPCPATQPAAAAPDWSCTGAPPAGVIAYALHDDATNPQVARFCAFVYESPVVEGEFYAAVAFDNGTDVFGPDNKCSADFSARRHLYFSDLDADCGGIRITYPDEVDDQVLSNRCRKMIRNIARNDAAFEPDIQYFAATREEADAKLAVLDTAEIACIGIDDTSGQPYRPTEVWVVQAQASIQRVP